MLRMGVAPEDVLADAAGFRQTARDCWELDEGPRGVIFFARGADALDYEYFVLLHGQVQKWVCTNKGGNARTCFYRDGGLVRVQYEAAPWGAEFEAGDPAPSLQPCMNCGVPTAGPLACSRACASLLDNNNEFR